MPVVLLGVQEVSGSWWSFSQGSQNNDCTV